MPLDQWPSTGLFVLALASVDITFSKAYLPASTSKPFSMANKKLKALIIAGVVIVVAGALAVGLSHAEFFQGKLALMSRSGTITTPTTSTTSSNAPWWCKPSPAPAGIGTPPPDAQPFITKKGGTSDSGSTTTPGDEGGILKYNPTTLSYQAYLELAETNPPEFKMVTLPGNNSGGSSKGSGGNSTVNGGSGNGFNFGSFPGNNKGGTSGTPTTTPGKDLITANHECSCNAAYFQVTGIREYFNCPGWGEKLLFKGTDSGGKNYEVAAYTPSSGLCQQAPKKDETVTAWHLCSCDVTSFTDKKNGKTYACPKPGMSTTYGEGTPYSVVAWTQPEYECKDQWQCPTRYEWDWQKIYNDCAQEKANECSGTKLFNPQGASESSCKAFLPTVMNLQCKDFKQCKETVKQFTSGKTTKEIVAAGLPTPYDCTSLYGQSNSSIWK